jgi:hypothetical protein
MDNMKYLNTTISGGYYHYNKYKRIFGLDSHDPKYYDQIITKVNLQSRKFSQESSNMSVCCGIKQ